MPLELADAITLPEGPERDYLWTLNFGPQHPATHTTLRLILTLDGETVVKAVPDIGFLHSGFEKLGEDLNYNQYVTVVDRMNYISPLANEIAWHHAVEKLLGIELTPRCKYIRTILAELMRIHDHLLNVGAAALDLGAFTAFLYAFYQRELIYDICETASGQRFHPSYTRVGGLMYDVNETFVDKVRAFVKDFPKTYADVSRLLTRNRIFVDRMKDIGVLSKEDAINLSCTGPIARASGVVRDLRKDEPYLAYNDFDFKVICATSGDSYARFLVRMEEMLEIIMPNRGFHPPREEVYGATESPNGELGFYVVSDGTERAYRARTRPPSFIHFAIFPYLIVGHQISDVVVVLGSLNIIAAELDR